MPQQVSMSAEEKVYYTGLGGRLRTARNRAGLSCDEVVRRLGGYDRSWLWRIEKGHRRAYAMMVHDLAVMYDVSVRWLMKGE